MSSSKLLLAQLIALAAEGKPLFREPIIGEPKPAPYDEKYDIAIQEAAVSKRQRKAARRARLNNLPNAR